MEGADLDQTLDLLSCRALTTIEDDEEALLLQATDQLVGAADVMANAHIAADFMPVVNPLAVISTAAGRSAMELNNQSHLAAAPVHALVTPATAVAYIHSPYIQLLAQMNPLMQQIQNPISLAIVQSSGDVNVDHDEELFLVRQQPHHGQQQQQQLLMNVLQQPYEEIRPATAAVPAAIQAAVIGSNVTDIRQPVAARHELLQEDEGEEIPIEEIVRLEDMTDHPHNSRSSSYVEQPAAAASHVQRTAPFHIHQALKDELNHQFHREQAAADDNPALHAQGQRLLGVRSVFEDAAASRESSTTLWHQDQGVHLLQRLPHLGPRVQLRRRLRANRTHMLHLNSAPAAHMAATTPLRSDLNISAATTPSSNTTAAGNTAVRAAALGAAGALQLETRGHGVNDQTLLEIEARLVHSEQQAHEQKSTAGGTISMSSMIGSCAQESNTVTTSCCNNNIGENFECNICFQKANEPVVTCCGHLFCWPCLYSWLHVHSFHKECPVCKGVIAENAITPIYGRDHHSTTSSNPEQLAATYKNTTCNNSGDQGSAQTIAGGGVDADAAAAAATQESPRIPPRPQAKRVESARQQRGRDERERERAERSAVLIRETEAAAAAARSSLQVSLETQLPGAAFDDAHQLNNSSTDPHDQEFYNNVLDYQNAAEAAAHRGPSPPPPPTNNSSASSLAAADHQHHRESNSHAARISHMIVNIGHAAAATTSAAAINPGTKSAAAIPAIHDEWGPNQLIIRSSDDVVEMTTTTPATATSANNNRSAAVDDQDEFVTLEQIITFFDQTTSRSSSAVDEHHYQPQQQLFLQIAPPSDHVNTIVNNIPAATTSRDNSDDVVQGLQQQQLPTDSPSSSSLQLIVRSASTSSLQSESAAPAHDQVITAAAAATLDELIINNNTNNNTRLMMLDHETRLITVVTEPEEEDDDDQQQQQLHTRSMTLQLLPGYIAHRDEINAASPTTDLPLALQEV